MGGPRWSQSERWRLAMRRGAQGSEAERLAEIIREEIREGMLPPGAVLPVEARLAFDLMVEESVVLSAYEQLTGEGLLNCRSDRRVCVAGTAKGNSDAEERGATIVPFARVGRPDKTPGDTD